MAATPAPASRAAPDVRAGQHLAAKVDLVGDPRVRVEAEELPRAGLRHEKHAALRQFR
jgi:hypothetical protein